MAHGAAAMTPAAPPLVPLRRQPHVPNLIAGEIFYGFYHRHPIVFARGLIFPGALLVGLLIVLGVIGAMNPASTDGILQVVLTGGGVLLILGMIMVILWIIYIYLDWRADYLLISDKRIIVNLETPFVRRNLREVPMGKVKNVIFRGPRLREVWKRLFNISSLDIDTAGQGKITFAEFLTGRAQDAMNTILTLQKATTGTTLGSKEQYRRDVVHSIIQGSKPPPPPLSVQINYYQRSGYGILNSLFPIRPQRNEYEVVWHRHWIYLLRAEIVPLGVIVAFEVTFLLLALISNVLQILDNPVLNVLNLVRPVVYIAALPFTLWQWENWRNDEFVVDKERLKTIETLPFGLDPVIKQTQVSQIVDVTVTVPGIIPNALDFGNLIMKTAGEATEFVFDGVPKPMEVHKEIMNRIEAVREQEQFILDKEIQTWIRTYVDERRAEPTPQLPPPADEGWTIW